MKLFYIGSNPFESSVVLEGYQASRLSRRAFDVFESSVVLEGYQAGHRDLAADVQFESSVVLEGYQASVSLPSLHLPV